MKKNYQKPFAKTILLAQESALLGGSNNLQIKNEEIDNPNDALSNKRNSIWD